MGLADDLNETAARIADGRRREERERVEANERAHEEGAELDALARAVARAASNAGIGARTIEVRRGLRRRSQTVVTPTTSFRLDYIASGYRHCGTTVTISVSQGFGLAWHDPDSASTGGTATATEYLIEHPTQASDLTGCLTRFMAKHGIQV